MANAAVKAPTLNEIEVARTKLGNLVLETPVWQGRTDGLLEAIGADTEVFFKLELMQHAGSFKPRGALMNMLDLSHQQLQRGVTAISAGNHAIAVGYAAKVLNTHAKVVMMKNANPARIAKCKAYGTEIILEADVHAAFERVRQIEKDEGLFFVHPFEGPLTALGTATVGLELCSHVPNLDAVIVPIGGGGLCAGIATAVKQMQPACQVFGVEPTGADSMHRSFAAGKPEAIDRVRTIADSLGAPYAAPYSFSLCRQFVDELVKIDDDAMCRAMTLLFNELKLAVEPAGAAATAALCGPLRDRLKGKRVGVIVCGTNIDADSFYEYVRRGMQS
ncbi:MAG: threonine/serine dehydratase [Deferribacteres bacterium]|nr:threonine/serine dehydratase [candidate division KSB1 bacterium]MCB9509686.1 threonine/serine dehydratase [Deferribacteres bacterium]